MTRLLTALLILAILGAGIAGWLIFNKTSTTTKQTVEISAFSTTSQLTPEEVTAKECGSIPDDLLGIKKSPYVNIEHLLWAPGCDNFGWSISWNIPDSDKRTVSLQPKGVYIHSIPDKKTTKIPLPQGYLAGYFLGWNSDHEMIVTYKFNDDPYNAQIYDIRTGQYHKN